MANTTGKKFGGRKKGTSNKSTDRAREAVAAFCEENTERMQGWLDEVAKDDPYKAINIVKDLLEYHVPKLQRTEQQMLDKNGDKADASIKVQYVDNPDT